MNLFQYWFSDAFKGIYKNRVIVYLIYPIVYLVYTWVEVVFCYHADEFAQRFRERL